MNKRNDLGDTFGQLTKPKPTIDERNDSGTTEHTEYTEFRT
jgi:hypothetical protein